MCLDDPEQLIHAQIELLTQRIEAREPRREGSPKKRQSPRRSMRRSLRRRRTAKWPSAPTVQGFQDLVLARAWGFVFTSSYRPVRVAEAKAKAKAKAEAQAKAKAEDSWGLGHQQGPGRPGLPCPNARLHGQNFPASTLRTPCHGEADLRDLARARAQEAWQSCPRLAGKPSPVTRAVFKGLLFKRNSQ